MSGDSGPEVERRKILSQALPYVLNFYWEARTALSPGSLASAALDQYQRVERDMKLQQQEVAALARDLGNLDMNIEGTGRISLTLKKDQLLNFVSDYLVLHFLTEGSGGKGLVAAPKGSGYDGLLGLPSKTVFVKLQRDPLEQNLLDEEVEKTKAINPSEVWIFSYFESRAKDIKLDPVFVSENRILYGHVRIVPITDVIKEATRGRFFVFAVRAAAGAEQKQGDDDSLRLLLIKNIDST
jgi:hypothetical protein